MTIYRARIMQPMETIFNLKLPIEGIISEFRYLNEEYNSYILYTNIDFKDKKSFDDFKTAWDNFVDK
jgi:hypothetical protein